MKFVEFRNLHEDITAVLNPLIGNDNGKPFSANEIVSALSAAKLDKKPEVVKKAIGMLEVLLQYVKLLSGKNTNDTIKGIERVKSSMEELLRDSKWNKVVLDIG